MESSNETTDASSAKTASLSDSARVNLGWLLSDKAIRVSLGVLVSVLLARHLGASQYGQLTYAITIVTIFGSVAIFGVNATMVRDLVGRPAREAEIMGSAFALRAATSCLAYAGAVLAVVLAYPSDQTLQLLVAAAGFSLLPKCAEVIKLWFESQTASKHIVRAELVAFALVTLGYFYLVVSNKPLYYFAALFSLQSVLFAIGYLIVYRRQGKRLFQWRPSRQGIAELYASSWPLLLSSIAVTIYMRIDQAMLGYLLDNETVGYYAVAVQWSEIWTVLPVLIAQTAFPALARTFEQADHAAFDKRYQILTNRLVGLSLLVVVAVMVLATPLVLICYGKEYESSIAIIRIYILSNLVVFNGALAAKWILLKNRQKLLLLKTASGAVMNIVLNAILIPRFGAVGAASATVISYAASGLLMNLAIKDLRPLFTTYVRAYGQLARSPVKALLP